MSEKPLSDLHKRFIEEYVINGGNGRQAYLKVRPNVQENSAEVAASKILRRPEAQEYLAKLSEEVRSSKVADLEECLQELTKYIRDDKTAPSAKLKAIEMRLKTMGAFIDKKVVSNDVTINVDIEE